MPRQIKFLWRLPDSGQPIASGLPHPESWVYLGIKNIPNQYQKMMWVKPLGLVPRQNQQSKNNSSVATDSIKDSIGMIGKSLEEYPGQWIESFEYQDLPRPAKSPQQYFEF